MSTVEASDHDYYNDTLAFAAEMLASICHSEGDDWTYLKMYKGSKRKWTVQSWQEGKSEEQAPLHCVKAREWVWIIWEAVRTSSLSAFHLIHTHSLAVAQCSGA